MKMFPSLGASLGAPSVHEAAWGVYKGKRKRAARARGLQSRNTRDRQQASLRAVGKSARQSNYNISHSHHQRPFRAQVDVELFVESIDSTLYVALSEPPLKKPMKKRDYYWFNEVANEKWVKRTRKHRIADQFATILTGEAK